METHLSLIIIDVHAGYSLMLIPTDFITDYTSLVGKENQLHLCQYLSYPGNDIFS